MDDKQKNLLITGAIALVVIIVAIRLLKRLALLLSLDGGLLWLLVAAGGMAICYPVARKAFPDLRPRQVTRIAALMMMALFLVGLILYHFFFR